MTVEPGSIAENATWILALTGIWTLVSPFVYADTLSGAALHNTYGVGIVVTLLALFVAYQIRQ